MERTPGLCVSDTSRTCDEDLDGYFDPQLAGFLLTLGTTIVVQIAWPKVD
jgi:hypothetical protein